MVFGSMCDDAVVDANKIVITQYRGVLVCLVLVGMIAHAWAFKQGQLKSETKLSFFLVMCFFLSVAIGIFFHLLFVAHVCGELDHMLFSFEMYNVYIFPMSLTTISAAAFFLWRLYAVFAPTEFSMGKWTVRTLAIIWLGLFGMQLYSAIIAVFFIHDAPSIRTATVMFSFVNVFSFSIVVLYASKLQKLLTNYSSELNEEHDDYFNMVFAQKVVILWFFNVIIAFTMMGLAYVGAVDDSPVRRILINILTPTFMFSDFLCVFLTYKKWEPAYKCGCFCCHWLCNKVWWDMKDAGMIARDANVSATDIEMPKQPTSTVELETAETIEVKTQ